MIPILFNLINTFVNAAENEVHSSFVLWILSTLSSVFFPQCLMPGTLSYRQKSWKKSFHGVLQQSALTLSKLALAYLNKKYPFKKKIYRNHISGQNSLISMKMLLKTKEKKDIYTLMTSQKYSNKITRKKYRSSKIEKKKSMFTNPIITILKKPFTHSLVFFSFLFRFF